MRASSVTFKEKDQPWHEDNHGIPVTYSPQFSGQRNIRPDAAGIHEGFHTMKNGEPEKRGVPKDAPQFSFKRVQLELDADTHFHRSWGRSLLREQPELCRRACNGEGGIQQLVVVQNVIDTEGSLSAESFADSYIFL